LELRIRLLFWWFLEVPLSLKFLTLYTIDRNTKPIKLSKPKLGIPNYTKVFFQLL